MALKASDFVHLHNHTQYSLLDGLTKVPELMDFVQKNGMQAVAQTDHGTLSGAIEFYKEATAKDIKPVIGMETYVASRTIADKDPAKDKKYYHLILLAMNDQGLRNLMRLSTIANLEGFYYKPRVDHVLLEKYSEGLIVLSGCIGGELGENIRQEQYDKAKEIAGWYKKIFGDRYYIEVQDHGHPEHPSQWHEQGKVNEQLLKLSKELDIPATVTCDAHYLKHEDQEAHEILLCVQTGSFLSDEKRMSLADFELHVSDPKEIIKRWGKTNPDLIKNTKKIADRCSVDIELGKILIPQFPTPEKETEKTHLHKLVWQGLAWRYGGKTEEQAAKLTESSARKLLAKEMIKRAEYELGVIDDMGFNGYFLIVSDFISWGKDQGIVFGPGRGSAAGSIVAYATKITEVDPLHHDLMFERFLNPSRISMPDIDVDIQDTRRDEVIEYCVQKYGKDRVANIVTFGRMAARNAVRDVARVLQVPYAEADRLAKMIPPPVQGRHIPLEESLKENADLKSEYESNETAQRVFDLAVRLEGTIRSHGVHAAGVVIAPDDIVKFAPLEMAQKGVVSTQFPMGPVEELGLLKMDFLGLSNLTIIKNALRIIKKVHQKEIEISQIPLDDKKTFELLARGDTTGVFQLESAGMKRYLRELKPNVFEDIVAMGALYRPGPMAEIPRFIQGKNDSSSITYLHETLEPILKDTYGVMVYQEQIIVLLQKIAGYSAGEADLVRKAIGKKKRDIMKAEEPRFIEGCKKQGLSDAQAKKLWDQIQPFADYSFNKAHATCYAMIAYWTAYLKAHYPAAFMAALMTSDADDTDRLAIEISECKHMGIDVLPPDVNESFVEFAVVPGTNQIRFGMSAIKNVGTNAVEEILRARHIDGEFKDLADFFSKVNVRLVNRKTLESLVKAGGFDRFGNRADLLHNLDVMLAYASRLQKEAQLGQVDLFGAMESEENQAHRPKLNLEKATQELNSRDQLLWERELLGLYLSQDPLATFEAILQEQTVPLNSLTPDHEGRNIDIGGSIVDTREITTKNGQKMAFVKVEDQFGEIELILFPNIYQKTAQIWERDKVVMASGKVSSKDKDGNTNDEIKILINEGREITTEEAETYKPTGKKQKAPSAKKSSAAAAAAPGSVQSSAPAEKRIYVRLTDGGNQDLLRQLKEIIDKNKGSTPVVLVLGPDENKQIIKLPGGVTGEQILDDFSQLVGANNVKTH